jgi:polyphosphate kinase
MLSDGRYRRKTSRGGKERSAQARLLAELGYKSRKEQ